MALYNQSPGQLDLQLVLGDTFSTILTFSVSGVALNLTGYTFVAYAGSLAMTVTAVSLVAGQINISLTSAQTAALHDRDDWYLELNHGGVVETILSGRIIKVQK